jgi:predicted DNA-binding transcriptional regulator AlpA
MSKKQIGECLTAIQLAKRWHMSVGTLCNWRSQGKSPKYIKIGKTVLYPLEEVEAFERDHLKRSTVDGTH